VVFKKKLQNRGFPTIAWEYALIPFPRPPTEFGAEGTESDHGNVNKQNHSSISKDIRSNPVPSVRRQTPLHERIAKFRHLLATVTEAIWFNAHQHIVQSKPSAKANWSWYISP
jgi:hypothetical protein